MGKKGRSLGPRQQAGPGLRQDQQRRGGMQGVRNGS